ncbi:MAG: hypothetical protein ACHQM6_03780 [Candidatus Kapaibacterium sp.]
MHKKDLSKLLTILSILLAASTSNAQWQKAPIAGGSFYDVLRTSTSSFAYSYSTGWQVKFDGKDTWDSVNRSFSFMTGYNNSVYALTNTDQSIYSSSDGGRNWQKYGLPGTFDSTFYPSVLGSKYLVASNDTVYFLLQAILYRSTNRGLSWNFVDSSFKKFGSANVGLNDVTRDTIAMGVGNNLYFSVNGGTQWKKSSIPWGAFFFGGSYFYMSGYNLYRTDNLGLTSMVLKKGVHGNNYANSFLWHSGTRLFLNTIDSGMLSSTDYGVSWSALPVGFFGNVKFRTLSSNSGIIIAVSQDAYGLELYGLWRSSDDGATWKPATVIDNIDPNNPVKKIVSSGDTLITNFYDDHKLSCSIDGGASWQLCPPPYTDPNVGDYVVDIAFDDENIYAMTTWVGLYVYNRHSDNGWQRKDKGIAFPPSYNGFDSNWIAVTPAFIVASVSKKMYRSFDHAQTWHEVHFDLPTPNIDRIVSSGTRLYSLMYWGPYTSDDNGDHWQPANIGIPAVIDYFTGSGNELYIATGFGLFHSFNAGDTWEQINTQLGGGAILISEKILFLGGGYSKDQGHTIISYADGSGINPNAMALTKDYIIGIDGSNLYRRSISEFNSTHEIKASPTSVEPVKMLSASANPFQTNVTIHVYSGSADDVSLKVYNLMGQLTSTLFQGVISKGDHNFSFEPQSSSDAVFICIFQTSREKQILKLIKR